MKQNRLKGEFLTRHVSTSTKKTELEVQTTRKLVKYKNTMVIRSYSMKENNVEFVTKKLIRLRKENTFEYLFKRGHVSNIIDDLPDYFVQINRSTIININFLTGRRTNEIEIGDQFLLFIGKKYREAVEHAITKWLSHH